jgi:hypothetical protein
MIRTQFITKNTIRFEKSHLISLRHNAFQLQKVAIFKFSMTDTLRCIINNV